MTRIVPSVIRTKIGTARSSDTSRSPVCWWTMATQMAYMTAANRPPEFSRFLQSDPDS